MKNTTSLVAVATSTCLLILAPHAAHALPSGLVGTTGSLQISQTTSRMGTNHGGEYTIRPTGGQLTTDAYDALAAPAGSSTFQTFCVERNEWALMGANNYTVNYGAVLGGVAGAVGGIDLVSAGTSWLYEQFARGTLGSYFYDPANPGDGAFQNRRQAATTLQDAIWFLEDEYGLGVAPAPGSNIFYDAAVQWATGQGLGVRDNALDQGMTNVGVLNHLRPSDLRVRQDMLYFNDAGAREIPDGGTSLLLLGLGLGGLGGLRRHFKS